MPTLKGSCSHAEITSLKDARDILLGVACYSERNGFQMLAYLVAMAVAEANDHINLRLHWDRRL